MNLLEAMVSKADIGYVYVMEFRFQTKTDYKTLYKVGITINHPIDRMLQVTRSFFQSRRYVPECRLLRYRKVPEYSRLEKELHTILKEYNYKFSKSFDGSTEYFDLHVDQLLCEYDKVVPLTKGKRYEQKLPKWDKPVGSDSILDEDEDGYVTDTIQVVQKSEYYVR
jgi:hypothetical protein